MREKTHIEDNVCSALDNNVPQSKRLSQLYSELGVTASEQSHYMIPANALDQLLNNMDIEHIIAMILLRRFFLRNGKPLAVVGGAVRDMLMGNTIKDIDFITELEQAKDIYGVAQNLQQKGGKSVKHGRFGTMTWYISVAELINLFERMLSNRIREIENGCGIGATESNTGGENCNSDMTELLLLQLVASRLRKYCENEGIGGDRQTYIEDKDDGAIDGHVLRASGRTISENMRGIKNTTINDMAADVLRQIKCIKELVNERHEQEKPFTNREQGDRESMLRDTQGTTNGGDRFYQTDVIRGKRNGSEDGERQDGSESITNGVGVLDFKKELSFDIAMARTEVYLKPTVLPDVTPATIVSDLKRRDFSINALALLLTGGEHALDNDKDNAEFHTGRLGWEDTVILLNPFSGVQDLIAGQIRILHKDSFRDDPTRIFRAIKYAARYNFNIAGDTEQAIKDGLEYLRLLNRDRVLHELYKIAEEGFDSFINAVRLFGKYKIYKGINTGYRNDAAAVLSVLAEWKKCAKVGTDGSDTCYFEGAIFSNVLTDGSGKYGQGDTGNSAREPGGRECVTYIEGVNKIVAAVGKTPESRKILLVYLLSGPDKGDKTGAGQGMFTGKELGGFFGSGFYGAGLKNGGEQGSRVRLTVTAKSQDMRTDCTAYGIVTCVNSKLKINKHRLRTVRDNLIKHAQNVFCVELAGLSDRLDTNLSAGHVKDKYFGGTGELNSEPFPDKLYLSRLIRTLADDYKLWRNFISVTEHAIKERVDDALLKTKRERKIFADTIKVAHLLLNADSAADIKEIEQVTHAQLAASNIRISATHDNAVNKRACYQSNTDTTTSVISQNTTITKNNAVIQDAQARVDTICSVSALFPEGKKYGGGVTKTARNSVLRVLDTTSMTHTLNELLNLPRNVVLYGFELALVRLLSDELASNKDPNSHNGTQQGLGHIGALYEFYTRLAHIDKHTFFSGTDMKTTCIEARRYREVLEILNSALLQLMVCDLKVQICN